MIALVSGCVPVRTPSPGPVPAAAPNAPRYESVVRQDAATIAELRAAPAPREPELSTGATPSGDERSLNSKGYARVGDGYVPAAAGNARAWIVQQGQRVGADKALVYAPDADGTTHAAFYVRYRLPFGATFRTVTADERKALDSDGVQIGDVVGGTPASDANLQRGDFVTRFNGKPFADRAAFQELLRQNLGKRVTLTIRRDGETIERLVRLGVVAKPAPVEHK